MKSEPSECSFEDAWNSPGRKVSWWGVRNWQARNFIRDAMAVGDTVFFYHSSCKAPGIAGIARIASEAYPDELQFDPASPYCDPRSSREAPRWLARDVEALAPLELIGIGALRADPELADLMILRRGNRLSITPVSEAHWRRIIERHAAPRAGHAFNPSDFL
ncbi:MAG: EVE domain-containing protein [Duodenibacillus sp.]|nr:EVE domain-containing protein [Duodenibacillus sp.]